MLTRPLSVAQEAVDFLKRLLSGAQEAIVSDATKSSLGGYLAYLRSLQSVYKTDY